MSGEGMKMNLRASLYDFDADDVDALVDGLEDNVTLSDDEWADDALCDRTVRVTVFDKITNAEE